MSEQWLPAPGLSTYMDGAESESSLVLLALWRGDDVYWRSIPDNVNLTQLTSTVSGWYIGPIDARPAFMASLEYSSPSSPVNFTGEYIDLTASFSGSEFRAPKAGVYVIFWRVHSYNRLHSRLLVNDIHVGHAHSDQNTGSNMVILRLQKNDSVTVTINSTARYSSTMISGYLLFEN